MGCPKAEYSEFHWFIIFPKNVAITGLCIFCVCIYIYIYIYLLIYICMYMYLFYMYVRTYVRVYVCMYVYIYIYIYVHMCVCICKYINIYIYMYVYYIYIHTYIIYIYTYIHIYIYTYIHIYIYTYIHIYIYTYIHIYIANMPFKIVGETLFPCLATLSAVPFFWLWMPHPPTSVVVRTNERGPSIQVKEGASEAHERDSQINTGLKSKFYFKKDRVISLVHELHQSCLATISTSLVWWLFVSKSHSHQKACNDHSSNTPVTNPIPCSL